MSELKYINMAVAAQEKINEFIAKGVPFQVIEDDVMKTPQIKLWLAYCDKKEECEALKEKIAQLEANAEASK